MTDFGFKVSKTGFNVLTAEDHELAMTSANLSEIIAAEAAFVHTHSGTSTTTSINYTPSLYGLSGSEVIQFYFFDLGNEVYSPYLTGDTTGAFFMHDGSATSSQVKFRTTTNSALTFSILISVKLLYSNM